MLSRSAKAKGFSLPISMARLGFKPDQQDFVFLGENVVGQATDKKIFKKYCGSIAIKM